MKNWKTWQKIAVAAAVPTVILLGYVGYRTLIQKKPLFPLFPKKDEDEVDEAAAKTGAGQLSPEELEKERTTAKKEEKFRAMKTPEEIKREKFRGGAKRA